MQVARGTFCPLIKEQCITNKCMFWTHLLGKHPQTGVEMDEWDCAIYWGPLLQIENAKYMREAGAAVESFRNEVVKLSLAARTERKQLPAPPAAAKVIEGTVEKET